MLPATLGKPISITKSGLAYNIALYWLQVVFLPSVHYGNHIIASFKATPVVCDGISQYKCTFVCGFWYGGFREFRMHQPLPDASHKNKTTTMSLQFLISQTREYRSRYN